MEGINAILNNHLLMIALAFYSLGVATNKGIGYLEVVGARLLNIKRDQKES